MKIKLFALVLALALVLSCAAFAEEHAAEYLEAYYNVAPFEAVVTVEAFNDALSALGQDAVEAETLTMADAAVAAVKLAGMKELANAYTNEDAGAKVADTLTAYGVAYEGENANFVAAALDLGLVDASADMNGEVSGEAAAKMLYEAAEMNGMGRNYIGKVSDEDILVALRTNLNGQIVFDNETLNNVGMEIILQDATTGYNLKLAANDAHFLPELTLRYGHSDLAHASQLIALMRSEGYDGYIQIEPKVSVYEYMIEWGEPGAPTATYAVRQVTDERYLAYPVEYDMMIEFETVEEKEAFHTLIETYAKKYDESYDADGKLVEPLLKGAWWQPLYSSTTEMENEEFGTLYNNVIYSEDGEYYLQSFCVEENIQAVADVVASVAPELATDVQTLYVNPAFCRYITGTDHQ